MIGDKMKPRRTSSLRLEKSKSILKSKHYFAYWIAEFNRKNNYEPNKTTSKERIILNAKGTRFEVLLDSLDHIPDSRMHQLKQLIENKRNNLTDAIMDENERKLTLSDLCDDYSSDLKEFYFNRDPELFAHMLKFYEKRENNRRVHLCLVNFCAHEVEKEFEYWKIDYEQHLDLCCLDRFQSEKSATEDALHTYKTLINNLSNQGTTANFGTVCLPKVRKDIWNFMEWPKTSTGSKIYSVFSTFMIAISILINILRSVPKLNPYYGPDPLHNPYDLVQEFLTGWFTIELAFRFISSPNQLTFFLSIYPLCDLMWILVNYVWLAFWHVKAISTIRNLAVVLRIIVLFRFFRISDSLMFLFITTRKSLKQIAVFFVYMLLGALIFSILVFQCEKDEPETRFDSIPSTFWYCIITMTTVGYGDMYPVSIPGKILGGLCALSGIIIVAMPISLLTNNFCQSYDVAKKKEKLAVKYYKKIEEDKGVNKKKRMSIKQIVGRNDEYRLKIEKCVHF